LLQERIIRIIAGDQHLAHVYYEELDLTKFSNINKYLAGIKVYKYLNNLSLNTDDNYVTKKKARRSL